MRPLRCALGLATLAAAWLGALPWLLPGPFSAHMTMHMAVVAVAAPLIAFGLAGTRADPVRRLPRFFAVVPASIAELILVWGWHTPALHHAARHSSLMFVLEQGSFLLSGLWLWLSAVGGSRRERAGSGIVALLLTCMHMTLLGALLALPPRPLYAHGAAHGAHPAHAGHGAERPRISALADQHLGGAIMIVLGGAAYLCGGLWLALGLVREKRGVLAGSAPRAGLARLSATAAPGIEPVEPRP
jgi:putative membrane protein